LTLLKKIDEKSLDHLLIIRPADDADLFLPFGKPWRRSKADVAPSYQLLRRIAKRVQRPTDYCVSAIARSSKKQPRGVISHRAAVSHLQLFVFLLFVLFVG
jgi:hypothetical protein